MLRRLRGYSNSNLPQNSGNEGNNENKTKSISSPNSIPVPNNLKERIKLNLNRKNSNHQASKDQPNTDRPTHNNEYDDIEQYDHSISYSAPVSPKDISSDQPDDRRDDGGLSLSQTRERRSSSYIKAVEEANVKAKEIMLSKEREKQNRKQEQLEGGYYSETGEYYSAYESDDEDTYTTTYQTQSKNLNHSSDQSDRGGNGGNIDNGNMTLMQSAQSIQNAAVSPQPSHKTVAQYPSILAYDEDDFDDQRNYNDQIGDETSDGSEFGRSPRKVYFSDQNEKFVKKIIPPLKRSEPIQNQQVSLTEDNLNQMEMESVDPSLPDIPPLFRINLPVAKRVVKNPSQHYATLSRTLDLKHPCSPRLTESRQELIQYQKIIGLQNALFNLRVDFWKIENSRLIAIENYRNLAIEAGFQICDNCKRLLRNHDRIKKYGNYHVRQNNPEKPHRHIRYRCTKRTFDEHILNSSASKFYPIPLEKKS